jgi:RNA polymerase-binding protein DksA
VGTRSATEHATLQQTILREHERTELRIASLRRDFDDIVAASASAATDDEHDPEGATIAFERQQIASLISLAEQLLEQLDAALAGLEDGSYGVCETCGTTIPLERLMARPTATHCIDCAGL